MNKKKILSILASICMVFTMVLSLNLNVFAAEDTQTLTVDGLEEGVTVDLYKIIDLNINEDGSYNTPLYVWKGSVAGYVRTNGTNYIGTENGNNNAVTQAYIDLDSDQSVDHVPNMDADITSFIQKMAASIRTGKVAPTKTSTVSTGTTVEFTGLDMGQYLILARGDEDAKNIYYATVHNVLPNEEGVLENITATKTMKHKVTDITKDVDESTVEVGQELTYTLEADIPTYPTNVADIHYVIGDKLSSGLTFDANSVVVKIEDVTLLAGTDYTLNTTQTENATFTVTMKKDILLTNANQKVTVTYNATVNTNAVVNKENLKNDAYLEFNTDPFNTNDFSKIPTEEQVYTYNIDITKVGSGNNNDLEGAEFELYKDDESTALKFKYQNNSYVLDESGNTTLRSDENGKVTIKGLDVGTYKLKETKPPVGGYIKPDGEFIITLIDTAEDGTLDEGSKATGPDNLVTDVTATDLTISFNVVNKKPGDLDLPITGGTGTMMYTLGGLVVMGGAIYIYLSNKKKHAK